MVLQRGTHPEELGLGLLAAAPKERGGIAANFDPPL
jgi:hypothetical protein